MKAVLSKEPGGPSTLVVEEIAKPEPKKGEVLVKVKIAALNFFDCLIIEDKYQFRPPRPFSIAAEMAGVVEAVGEGVDGFAPGERVCGYLPTGTAREFITAPTNVLSKIPDGVSDEDAACIMVTYGTSYHALKQRADLKSGETLAVLGASGGVGQAAVELGKIMGANVIACASTNEKLEFCRECGADEVVNYTDEDLKDRLKKLTGGKGCDVIYDPVGGDFSEAAFRAIAWEGRFLVVGFASGPIPKIPLNLPLLKGADLRGVFWGTFTARQPQDNADNISDLLGWLADGSLKPHVDSVFPMEEAAKALDKIASRDVKGKVLLRVAD
ncbi:NADPH:quinone oxidoreductase family protein [Ahrensia sp. R2A130]|uniref:NADPH:quinone oxidoreductase family protein n=1 Tax=Ahrensia sp. R2A130 TaxID=744979 RepID=UPI0001E0A471|nr:NADPH:quinone oxidoreductase family protein [Ahrensia sp. R2A130]EFL89659.1 alcohol dehydrogenase [Ahrensia sp. R2A130]